MIGIWYDRMHYQWIMWQKEGVALNALLLKTVNN